MPDQPAREVGPMTLLFASSAEVRALREDPDAILVGEMRDLETIRSGHDGMAETGHPGLRHAAQLIGR